MKKAQIMVIDLLFFSLIVVLIIFLIVNNIYQININDNKTKENVLFLENILFVDNLVSKCDLFAYTPINRTGLCYKNILEVNLSSNIIEKLRENEICKIKINEVVIFDDISEEIEKKAITRGVIDNGKFKVFEISFC